MNSKVLALMLAGPAFVGCGQPIANAAALADEPAPGEADSIGTLEPVVPEAPPVPDGQGRDAES